MKMIYIELGLVIEGSRGDLNEVIVEEFIDFDYEITLLTLTQNNGKTLFCPPIGHRQKEEIIKKVGSQ